MAAAVPPSTAAPVGTAAPTQEVTTYCYRDRVYCRNTLWYYKYRGLSGMAPNLSTTANQDAAFWWHAHAHAAQHMPGGAEVTQGSLTAGSALSNV